MALPIGLAAIAFFLWAPRSGRYTVNPELGFAALQRDERTQTINDKAARNAFVVTMLAVAALTIYFGASASPVIPMQILNGVLILGVLTYFAIDLFLRRT